MLLFISFILIGIGICYYYDKESDKESDKDIESLLNDWKVKMYSENTFLIKILSSRINAKREELLKGL